MTGLHSIDPRSGVAGCPAAKIIFPIKAKAAKYTGTPDRRITPASRLEPLPIRVSYARVAEYQRRRVVHFHAVIRLDGPGAPTTGP